MFDSNRGAMLDEYPKTLLDVMRLFPTEDDCRSAIAAHRWSSAHLPECGRCGESYGWQLRGRDLFECGHCHHQSSVTAGTIFHRTRTDLRKWFLAIWLMACTKKTPSAAELQRQLGVTYKTAWLIRRKIQHAMTRRDGELMLQGIVEMDEAFIGGKDPGVRGRGQPGKSKVAVCAEGDSPQQMGRAHMRIIPDASGESLTSAAAQTIEPGNTVRTDGWVPYGALGKHGYDHQPRTQTTAAIADVWLPWVHIVISNFKRWLLDAFHGVSAGHLQAYLDEFTYRLNRRHQRTDLFRRLLNRCTSYLDEPVTYNDLTLKTPT